MSYLGGYKTNGNQWQPCEALPGYITPHKAVASYMVSYCEIDLAYSSEVKYGMPLLHRVIFTRPFRL